MSANRQDFKVESDSEARSCAKRLVDWVRWTPSAADKLPRYILEQVDMMELYAKENGWDFLD